MIIAAVDTETTGIPELADAAGVPQREIVEFGYCVYDTDLKQPVAGGFDVFEVNCWDEMADDAQKAHHIPKSLTEIARLKPSDFDVSRILRYKPRVIIAHNAPFDYPFVTRCWPELGNSEWLCSQRDLDHSKKINNTSSKRLMHLALEYGFPVVGWHRAYGDAEMVCRIAAEHDLEEALILRKMPRYKISTNGRYDATLKLKLKELKFRWFDKEQHPPYGAWINDNVTEVDLPLIKNVIIGLRPDWDTKIEPVKSSY